MRKPYRLAALLVLFGAAVCAMLASGSLALGQTAPASSNTFSGVFTIVYGDPSDASAPHQSFYFLNDKKGREYSLTLQTGMVFNALQFNGQEVTVQGTLKASPNNATTSSEIEVQALQLIPNPGTNANGRNAVNNQKFVSLLCKFSDKTVEPRSPTWFSNQLGGSYPQFNHYFKEQSYNNVNIDGSVATNVWVTLPRTHTAYLQMSVNTRLFTLVDECTAAADSMIAFDQYLGINLIFNDTLGGSAWGGQIFRTLDGLSKVWRFTWMPYHGENSRFGWREHGILGHEMGHAFGAPHSGSSIGYEYGSSWDVVSNPQAHCNLAGVMDVELGCVGQHMAAPNKELSGFFSSERVYSYTTGSGQQTVTLKRLAQPTLNAGDRLLIKVPADGNKYYTVEARFRVGYDKKLPADGVIIHYVDPALLDSNNPNTPMALIVPPPGAINDATRSPGGCQAPCGVGAANAVWNPGQTFENASLNLKIRVDSFSAADGTAVITINPNDTPPTEYEVTIPQDDGSGTTNGTLSFGLKNAAANTNITFNLPGGATTVSVTGQLPAPTNAGLTIDGEGCGESDGRLAPRITLQASGNAASNSSINGLVLNKAVTVKDIHIIGFGGKELVVSTNTATSNCVVAN
jgi:M6 family metalloprotease-like protein